MAQSSKINVDELKLALQAGEGQRLEFKERISSGLAKELVAFANAEGGRVIVGVNDRNGLTGVQDSNAQRAQLQDIARNCDPSIDASITSKQLEGKSILVIDVPEGQRKPYACGDGFYLRVGTNSQKMKRDELLEFIRRVQPYCFDEQLCPEFQYPKDFDAEAFRFFLSRAGISPGKLKRDDILCNLGVAKRRGRKLVFNNAGVLFFARQPTKFIRQAVVTGILLAGTTKVDILDRKDFDSNLMENVRQAMIFLKRHLSLRYKIETLQREEILELPESALREAVLNAVTHRDYAERGAVVMVEIYSDRVEISDPGGLPPGLKRSELGRKSVHRNPLIADLFQRMGEVEKVGSGIRRMREAAKEAGVPAPRFEATGFFTITYKKPDVTPALEAPSRHQVGTKLALSQHQVAALELCRVEKSLVQLMEGTERSDRTKFRDGIVKPLLEAGLLALTIPDKPRSSKQRYVTTSKGLGVLKNTTPD